MFCRAELLKAIESAALGDSFLRYLDAMSQITGDGASNPVKDGSLEEVNVFVPQRRSWFYNTFTQAIIIGLGEI